MSSFFASVLNWLPIAFDWAIAPFALILLLLSLRQKTRPVAATGFLVAAGISAAILSVLVAASVFYVVGYGRAVLNLLLNFGPSVTRDYIVTLIRANGMKMLAFAPIVAAAFSSAIAAIYLRADRPDSE